MFALERPCPDLMKQIIQLKIEHFGGVRFG